MVNLQRKIEFILETLDPILVGRKGVSGIGLKISGVLLGSGILQDIISGSGILGDVSGYGFAF